MPHCAAFGCDFQSKGNKGSDISIHSFPHEEKRRKQWEDACGRTELPKDARLCSLHFHPDAFESFNRLQLVKELTGAAWYKRRLKANAVPTIFPHKEPTLPVAGENRANKRTRQEMLDALLEDCKQPAPTAVTMDNDSSETVSIREETGNGSVEKPQFVHMPLKELESQKLERAKKVIMLDHDYATSPPAGTLDKAVEIIQDLESKLKCVALPTPIISQFCASDAQIRFYTKLPSVSVFKIFWEHIAPSASQLMYWSKARRIGEEAMGDTGPNPSCSMSLINEFLMYSMRIAADMKEQLLADMFQCSVATVSRVTITWANYLFLILGTVPIWMSREKIRSDMPEKFKKHCLNVRVILDSTEIAVTAPPSLTFQSEMFSHFENRTTLKALIGVTPHGFVSFFSQLYTGCISDKEITRLCGILQLLEPGDEVMADKGFVIDELLSDVGAKLIIPPFKRSAQFSKEDTEKTQAIAHLRRVVERVIDRIKSNHIWDSPVPLTLIGAVRQIWYNCCMMVNFQEPLSCDE